MRKQAGFTIMELMIVVTIVGVLTAASLPGLNAWVRNASRTAAVTEFLGSMHLARSEAIKRNSRIGMCPSSDAATCDGTQDWGVGWLVFVDSDGDMDAGNGEEIMIAHEGLKDPWTLISDGGEVALDFRPNGRVETSTNATTIDFSLCDDRGPDEGRALSVSNSGRPQTALKAQDGSDPAC